MSMFPALKPIGSPHRRYRPRPKRDCRRSSLRAACANRQQKLCRQHRCAGYPLESHRRRSRRGAGEPASHPTGSHLIRHTQPYPTYCPEGDPVPLWGDQNRPSRTLGRGFQAASPELAPSRAATAPGGAISPAQPVLVHMPVASGIRLQSRDRHLGNRFAGAYHLIHVERAFPAPRSSPC
jgi:hypothetical protein